MPDSEAALTSTTPSIKPKRYVVLEGIDASGKSTLAKRMVAKLEELGFEAIFRFEPTNGPWGRQIRALLSKQGTHEDVPGAEWMRLFKNDRAEHTEKIIRPALARRAWVIQDRSYYSTAAYQGAQGVDIEEILRENRKVAEEASLVLVLDLPVDVAHHRILANRAGALESLEAPDYLRRVAHFFDYLEGPNIVHINAKLSQDQVFDLAWEQMRATFSDLRIP